jgi:transposase
VAFGYFGGVFRLLRYDNLRSAVKKTLRGYQRIETDRLIAFRSHWGFRTEFCNPARGHEKGGVEGEVGFYEKVIKVKADVAALLNSFPKCMERHTVTWGIVVSVSARRTCAIRTK